MSCTDLPILSVYDKQNNERRFFDKYTVIQLATAYKFSDHDKFFRRYDIYKMESMEEYENTVWVDKYLRELTD